MLPSKLLRRTVRWCPALVVVLAIHLGPVSRAGEVEVLRDPWGTPHVFAASEPDGFFGLGHAAAEDRLLQMELIRRKAAGRLAEVFGPDWVDADREARIAGHAAYALRAFAKLPARWQDALRAYAAGVNAWRVANPDTVTRRFQSLGIEPDPWRPADCLLAARGILSLGSPFSAGPVEEYHRFRELTAQVGDAEAARQSGMAIDAEVAIVSEAEMAKDGAIYERLKQRPRMPGFEVRPARGGEEPRKMSHAWAVSGRRSTTGKPILESDPQLTLSSPPFFYEFHLAAGRIDARGLGVPGCPGLFIGWNRRLAWGASALGVDSHVTFLDRLTPDGKGYVFEDQPVPFEQRFERIEVKGGQAVIQEVLTSRHGTAFNSLVRASRAGEAYLLYDAQTMDDGASARMMLEVLDAGNWTEFRRALEPYYYPGLHVVYADVDGNVGYHTMVHRPLTTRSPRRALEGWTGRDEVRGRIPFDELPHLLNPDSGYVSHANNLPVGAWYPYDLGLATGGTGDTSRSLRLRQMLDGDRQFSVEDFEAVLHRDDLNPLVAALLPIARKVVEEDQVKDAAVLHLLDSVKGWDLHDGTTDRFPAARGLGNTLTPYRGAGLQNVYGAGGGGISHLARDVGARFQQNGATPTNTLVRAYLVNWLRASTSGGFGGRSGAGNERAARPTQERPGATGDAGRTITIPYQRTIPHNLPVVNPALDFVSPPLTCLDQGTIWSQPGNLYSQIVDLADVDNSRSMMAPGNAEDDPFRTNQVDLWVRGTTHPAPLSRAKLEALGVTRTRLIATAYTGPLASALKTSPGPGAGVGPEGGVRFIAAIPTVTAATEPRPLPGRKPDDPRLEAAFRTILRQGTAPEEVDAKVAECRDYVKGNAGLTEQLLSAAVLGVYLIEEAAAGRLRVPYGSPHALQRLRTLLGEPGGDARAGTAEPAPLTSLANPGVSFTVPDKPYVVLRRGDLEVVVVDNRAVDDPVLPGHRAGYHGIGALRHARQSRNLFVPAYAGLNFEHIHDGTVQPREVLFEPRNAPMELRVIDDHIAELHQPPTPHWGLESCLRYELLPEGAIDLTFECIPRRDTFRNGYVGLFWASYIDQPESLDIHFRGVSDESGGQPGWQRGVTPAHGTLATHRAADDRREFAHDPAFPLELPFGFSRLRYSEPWFYGVCRGIAFVQMFRPQDNVRLTQSPSGGGNGCPAWDFQWFIPEPKIGQRYQLRMRAAYIPVTGPGDAESVRSAILETVARARP